MSTPMSDERLAEIKQTWQIMPVNSGKEIWDLITEVERLRGVTEWAASAYRKIDKESFENLHGNLSRAMGQLEKAAEIVAYFLESYNEAPIPKPPSIQDVWAAIPAGTLMKTMEAPMTEPMSTERLTEIQRRHPRIWAQGVSTLQDDVLDLTAEVERLREENGMLRDMIAQWRSEGRLPPRTPADMTPEQREDLIERVRRG